jgi:threonine dehydratase
VTIADGLRTSLGSNNFPIIQEHVDDFVLVSEKEIVDAMQLVYERMKCVIESSGAVALAGVLQHREQLKGKNVGIMLCGGNVDLTDYFNGLRKTLT